MRNSRRLRFETLESKDLLAIVWANEFATGPNDTDNPNFNLFGENEAVARAVVNRAIDDWEAVIENFNYVADSDSDPLNDLNNTFELTITATSSMQGFATASNYEAEDPDNPGQPSTTAPRPGKPMRAQIGISSHPLNFGWYFDETPHDDVEFAGIVSENGSSFIDQGAFIDPDPNLQNRVYDLYYTVLHEIGHAVGFTRSYDEFARAHDGRLLEDDQGNLLATMTSPESGHFDPVEHPNLVMTQPNIAFLGPNAGLPEPIGDPAETIRLYISDLEVQILEELYGYTVNLPSSFNSAHVMHDSITGTLLVQGAARDANGVGLDDDIDIEIDGGDVKVTVSYTRDSTPLTFVERTPLADVTEIIVHGNGGSDSITNTTSINHTVVDYVVSTNQDLLEDSGSVGGGATGDGIVDISPEVPGSQTTLRAAAVQDADFSGYCLAA